MKETNVNHLNSIILEGVIHDDFQVLRVNAGIEGIEFPIAVERHYCDLDKKEVKEVSVFNVRVYGNAAEIAKQKCHTGTGLRVVGRLKELRREVDGELYSKVVIIAEYIEYKAKYKAEQEG